MGNIDTFEEFVEKKSKEKNNIDWDARKSEWLKSVDSLYGEIKEWLEPLIDKKLIIVKEERKITLLEDFIGKYETRQLDIYIGDSKITLKPKGTLIIGSYGRIDLSGPKGELLIIEPEWNAWEFAVRKPKSETWEVNENSFKEIIKELI